MESNTNLSLISIDTKPLAETANLLIEKVSSAVGWVATRSTPQKTAVEQYIADIQNNPTLDPLVKAALITNAKKIIKEYCNQYAIIEFAINDLEGASKNSIAQLSDDWLAFFMDKARLASDKTIQALWGKILAQECKEPDSIPRHLLSILVNVDNYLATAFTLIKSHSILILDSKPYYCPIIKINACAHRDYFSSIGLTLDVLTDLDAIGLISLDFNAGYCFSTETEHCRFQYGNRLFAIDEDGEVQLKMGSIIFTRAGEQLCRIIDAKEFPDFVPFCLPDTEVKYHELDA